MEMDKVTTVEDEGGIDEIIDQKLKNFGFNNDKDYIVLQYDSIRSPQGGTPPPLHFDVGRIGVGAPSDGCSRTVEGRWQMKVDRPPFTGTCFRQWFLACSWQVLGEFSALLG